MKAGKPVLGSWVNTKWNKEAKTGFITTTDIQGDLLSMRTSRGVLGAEQAFLAESAPTSVKCSSLNGFQNHLVKKTRNGEPE